MATITLDLYSGRPNPVLEIRDELLGAVVESANRVEVQQPRPTGLGFRGLIIETQAAQNARFAQFAGPLPYLYIPRDLVPPEFFATLVRSDQVELRDAGHTLIAATLLGPTFRFSSVAPEAPAVAPPPPCAAAPPYDPNNWNHDPVLRSNNCYNYACATPTNTFAQPGRATGHLLPFPPTCVGATAGATSDGLVSLMAGTCQAQGHAVALVIANLPSFQDYHWYRMGADGMWSHKPGQTPVTNLDNSNHPISDPIAADRGPYTQFCGYMRVGPGAIQIG